MGMIKIQAVCGFGCGSSLFLKMKIQEGGTSLKNLKLKAARAAKDLSQEQLAQLVGVTRQTSISRENGRYNASLLLAHKLAR